MILNLKKIKFKAVDHEPRTVTINVNKEGPVTAGDIQTIQGIDVLNTDQVICTLDKRQKFEAEFDVRVGRGFFTGDENKRADMPIGVIPIDSIFSRRLGTTGREGDASMLIQCGWVSLVNVQATHFFQSTGIFGQDLVYDFCCRGRVVGGCCLHPCRKTSGVVGAIDRVELWNGTAWTEKVAPQGDRLTQGDDG